MVPRRVVRRGDVIMRKLSYYQSAEWMKKIAEKRTPRRGEEHGRHKITEYFANAIRSSNVPWWPQCPISESHYYAIRRGKRWAHLQNNRK